MYRLGSKLTYTQQSATGDVTETFGILAGDYDLVVPSQNRSLGSHPDAHGVRTPVVDQEPPPGRVSGVNGLKEVRTRWEAFALRGTIDMNFSTTEGAVVRVNAVEMYDEDMPRVPYNSLRNTAADWIYISR